MKAVIYDKWLHSLGGGEVVACSIAKILKDHGYEVLFISGKEVSKETIFNKLKINLKGIEFKQVWNDEIALKKLVVKKDLFINISFMDYSLGFAKKNIYYANFPTKLYNDLRGMIFTRVLVPIISRFIKPIESLSQIEAPIIFNHSPAYVLGSKNKYALSNLTINKPQQVTFQIYLENFYKSFLENIKISFENAEIIDKVVKINHNANTIQFTIKFIPKSSTSYTYLNLNLERLSRYHNIEGGKVYLFYPKIYLSDIQNFLFSNFLQKITIRLRAGIFVNTSERLNTYQKILTYSNFAEKWIKRYWKMGATIIPPPVDLLYKKYKLNKYKKNNWICSVGRFFTLGHGKKQEILIEAFKKFYDKTEQNPSSNKEKWQLHLVGGLGDEPTSIDFFKYLKEKSKGYPVFFHLNVSRQEVEDVYLRSKIYWHATGFGEDEGIYPVRFEHFGIAPIEALSAKCIPILFNGGGLREIINAVNLDKQKNLFKTIEELVDRTSYYQSKQNQKLDWKFIFKQLDKSYSLEAFKSNFFKLLSSLKLKNNL